MCGLNTGNRDRERTRLKLIKEEEDKYSTFSKLAKQGSQRAVKEAKAILQWIKRSGTVKSSERIAGGSNKLKSKFSHRRYYPDSFDPEPLKDPPQTSASSGTGNDKIRYRSPPSTELMEYGTATV
ncbi:unnamed protein product [Brassica oleracea]